MKILTFCYLSLYFSQLLVNESVCDDTTLMAESEEELKSLVMKVKVESKKLA